MSILDTVIVYALIISVVTNVLFMWFSRKLITNSLYFTDSISYIRELIDDYKQHLEFIDQLPATSGDSTIADLKDHTRDTYEELGKFLELVEDENNEKKENR